MTEEVFIEALLAALGEVTEDPIPADFGLDWPLEDLALDSLGRVELLTCIEERFDIEIDDDVLRVMKTPRDLYSTILAMA
jgi:acyl carrier protein